MQSLIRLLNFVKYHWNKKLWISLIGQIKNKTKKELFNSYCLVVLSFNKQLFFHFLSLRRTIYITLHYNSMASLNLLIHMKFSILRLIRFVGFLCFTAIQTLQAQQQGSIWYFGNKAGLDFRSGSPVALLDGQINTDEGCATISDANGNLLFYSDGGSVWNRNHQKMPNGTGLSGDSSATQAAVIVPHPGNTNQYYLFTVSSNLGGGGLRYHIIDMRSDNGRGDIIVKNRLLLGGETSTEKITAVRQVNNLDFWIIAHRWNSDEFYIYSLNSLGLDVLNPTIQHIGLTHTGVNRNAHGHIKASSDGSKLAVAIGATGICELFDFDNTQGILSNPFSIPIAQTNNLLKYVYGVEFSPDNRKLYLTFRYSPGIDQYDITAPDIIGSRYRIQTQSAIGAIQLARDNKIYATMYSQSLGIIHNPDALGSAINFKEETQGVSLGGKSAKMGLPNFVNSYFLPIPFESRAACSGDTSLFVPANQQNIQSVLWDFGDTLSGIRNTSTDIMGTHIYLASGNYTVTLQATLTNGVVKTTTSRIIINDFPPSIDLGRDTTLCPGSKLFLNARLLGDSLVLAANANLQYTWIVGNDTTSSLRETYLVEGAGTYIVKVKNDCGESIDSIRVSYYDTKVELPIGDLLCEGETVQLDVSSPNAVSYLWQDGSTNPQYVVNKSGEYHVTVNYNNGCVSRDTVTYTYWNDIRLFAEKDSVLCRGESAFLTFDPLLIPLIISGQAMVSDFQIFWSTGATNEFAIQITNNNTTSNDQVRLYWVVVIYKGICTYFDDIRIRMIAEDPPMPALHFNRVCVGENVLLDATREDIVSYRWKDGSTQPTLLAQDDGKYWVEISTGSCSTVDTFFVNYTYPPYEYNSFYTLCENNPSLTLYASAYDATYVWDDGSTSSTRTITEPGTYSVNINNPCGSAEREFYVELNTLPPFNFSLGKDTTLCPGQTLVLAPNIPIPSGYFSIWQDGSYEEDNFTVENEGKYFLTVFNDCSFTRDTINVRYKKIPKARFNDQEYICDQGSVLLDASTDIPDVSYVWRDSTNQVISTASNITVNQIGTYTVRIEYGCEPFVEYQALVLPLESTLQVNLGEDRFVCNEEKVILNPALINASYLWQDGSTQSIYEVSQSGKYWVETVVNGCSAVDTVQVVFLDDILNLDLGTTRYLCNNEPIRLAATSPKGVYQWFNEQNQLISSDSILVTNQAGIYRVQVSNSCESISDTIAVIDNQLAIELGNERFACQGTSVVLDGSFANPQTTYRWQDNSIQAQLTVLQTGIYTVEATLNGCTVIDSVQVTFLDEPAVNLGNNQVICRNASLVLDATNPNATFSWYRASNPTQVISTAPTLNVQIPDTYWVRVDNTCKIKIDTVAVSLSQLGVLNLASEWTICEGANAQIDANTAQATVYQWFDAQNQLLTNQSVLSTNQAGIYYVTATSAEGCMEKDTIQILIKPDLASINLGKDTTLCAGNTLLLQAISNDPTATIAWQDGSTQTTLQVNQSGLYKVIVTNNCESVQDEIQVNFNPNPTLNLGEDKILCPQEVLVLEATNTGGTYLWQDDSTLPTFTVNQAGTYHVLINLNGCITSDTVIINYQAPLQVQLGKDTTLCAGNTLLLQANTNDPTATYLWQDGSTQTTFQVNQTGSYKVIVSNTCESGEDEIQINFNPNPIINLGEDRVLCPQEMLVLDATNAGATYLWQDGSTLPSFNVNQAGIYEVFVNLNGCIVSDKIAISYQNPLQVQLGNDTTLCAGSTIVLVAGSNSNNNYLWQDGSILPTFVVNQAGIYSVTVQNGCETKSDQISIQYTPRPVVILPKDTVLCSGETLLLDVSSTLDNITYLWQDGSTNSTYTIRKEGLYWVEVRNEGCTIYEDIKVSYVDCPLIPNAITPALKDDKNDTFVLESINLSEWIIEIYNRDGKLIYQNNNYQNDWSADNQPSGVYYYLLKRKDNGFALKGWLNVFN